MMKKIISICLVVILFTICLSACEKVEVEKIYTERPKVEYKDTTTLHYLDLKATEGGTYPASLDKDVSGYYPAGAEISFYTRSMPGYKQVGWQTSAGGHFCEVDGKFFFIMPENDVVVTAVFKKG